MSDNSFLPDGAPPPPPPPPVPQPPAPGPYQASPAPQPQLAPSYQASPAPQPPPGPPPVGPYGYAPTPQQFGNGGGAPTYSTRAPGTAGPSFFRSLFDLSFRSFITRRLAGVFYAIGLVVIGGVALVGLVSGISTASTLMRFDGGVGTWTLLLALVGTPVGAFLAVIVLRLFIESVVALVAVAENTGRTASDSEPGKTS